MNTAAKPIVATTSLSFLLHGVAFAGLLMFYDQVVMQNDAVGPGVDIHLISSVLVSDQQEADVAREQKMVAATSSENLEHALQKKFDEKLLTSVNSERVIVTANQEEKKTAGNNRAELKPDTRQEQLSTDNNAEVASIAQSTNASRQQHAILELLHQRISDNKEYPYLARRQRREGVATVGFVLHPDGTIDNAHLVSSSRAVALDRAALSAVKQIEPFTVAQDYLEQSETFQVDIEFNLL